MKPLIPAWLDDAGLSPAEMRVMVHFCRRADNKSGIAWPSYESMVAITRMSKSTIRRAIEELKRRELIQAIGKPFAGSCRYKVLPIVPPEGQKEVSNSSTREPIEAAPIVSPENCNSSISLPPIVPPEGQEGNPKKEVQRRKSKAGDPVDSIPLPFTSKEFAEAWENWKRHRKEIKKKLTETSVIMQFQDLTDIGEPRAIAAINHSIKKGWQGIYEEKSNPTSPATPQKKFRILPG